MDPSRPAELITDAWVDPAVPHRLSPRHHKSAVYRQTWSDLARLGYALTSDESIGLPEKFRQDFRGVYFKPLDTPPR